MLMYIIEAASLERESQLCLLVMYAFIDIMKFAASRTASTSSAVSATAFAPRHGTWCGAPTGWDEVVPGRGLLSCGGLAEAE